MPDAANSAHYLSSLRLPARQPPHTRARPASAAVPVRFLGSVIYLSRSQFGFVELGFDLAEPNETAVT